MKLKLIRDDTRGSTLVEFTLTVPIFLLLMFGLVQAGVLLWTQVGLQHGVEMAARCASVNYAANQANLNTSCFTINGVAVAPSTVIADTTYIYIKKYAAQNSLGINLPYTYFTVSMPLCGTNLGYLVTASFQFNLIHYVFSTFFMTLSAQSCYPI